MTARLPNCREAVVDERKITAYLLSTGHPEGASKARFFRARGFDPLGWTVLRDALIEHGCENAVRETMQSRYGTKYVVDCKCETPDGTGPCIRTVWIVGHGETIPRLVTAHPNLGYAQAMIQR